MPKLELPLGFGAALLQNEQAIKTFEALTDDQKQNVIEQTHHIRSKSEMRSFVNRLADGIEL